jgi:hypothetical protein
VQQPAPIDPLAALAKVMQLRQMQQQGEAQAQQARIRDQQLETGKLEIAAKQRTQAGQAALAAAIKDPRNRTPDGAVNHEQIASTLSESFPDVAEAWLAQTSKNADALDKLASTKRAHAEAAQEAIGSLAASASNEREFEASLGLLASQGILDEPTATRVAQQASDAGPEGWKAIRDQYVHLAPSARKAALSADAKLHEPQKLSPGEVFGVPGQPPAMSVPEKKPNPQTEKFLLDGRPVMGAFQPDDKGGKYLYLGQDVTARAKPIPSAAQININNKNALPPGNWDKTGEEFLSSIPAQWRKTVEKIAKYDEDPTKVASMRGGMRETLMQWVNQVNPDYDQAKFAIRNPTKKAFTTGPQGQQITALNTALEHLDLLQEASDALANGSFTPGNALFTRVKEIFGSASPTTFATIKEKVDKEIEAVNNKGVPTVSGTQAQRELAGKNSSPQAIKGYIDSSIKLMGSTLNSLDYQYKQAMGENDPFHPLSPGAQSVLTKRGFDPNDPSGRNKPETPKGPALGTEGMVNGKAAVWKTVGGITGWYAK